MEIIQKVAGFLNLPAFHHPNIPERKLVLYTLRLAPYV
jgi:hypothetical protein